MERKVVDKKIDERTIQIETVKPETIEYIKYDINHLIEEKIRLRNEIDIRNERISDIDDLIKRADLIGVDVDSSA